MVSQPFRGYPITIVPVPSLDQGGGLGWGWGADTATMKNRRMKSNGW